jgi:hypothetical protein
MSVVKQRRTVVLLEVSDWMARQRWTNVVILTSDQSRNPRQYLILTRMLTEQRRGWKVTMTTSVN